MKFETVQIEFLSDVFLVLLSSRNYATISIDMMNSHLFWE